MRVGWRDVEAARSARIRSRTREAGSSLGSCGRVGRRRLWRGWLGGGSAFWAAVLLNAARLDEEQEADVGAMGWRPIILRQMRFSTSYHISPSPKLPEVADEVDEVE